MTTIRALSIIDSLREGWYDSPITYNKKRAYFECESYQHSAIGEIRRYLMDHNKEDPIKVVDDFCYMVDDFACKTKNSTASFMFSVYYDVATDIMDALLGMS